MARERLEDIYRELIGDDNERGWELMQVAGIFFEELCIPGELTMPDDEIMKIEGLNVEAAMWGLINSSQRQAEEEDPELYHHDYAAAVALALVATAHVLLDKHPVDDRVQRFTEITTYSPSGFIKRFGD